MNVLPSFPPQYCFPFSSHHRVGGSSPLLGLFKWLPKTHLISLLPLPSLHPHCSNCPPPLVIFPWPKSACLRVSLHTTRASNLSEMSHPWGLRLLTSLALPVFIKTGDNIFRFHSEFPGQPLFKPLRKFRKEGHRNVRCFSTELCLSKWSWDDFQTLLGNRED